MPETIATRKPTTKRPAQAFPTATGAVRVEDLFPELKAKKKARKSDPAIAPVPAATALRKTPPAGVKPVTAATASSSKTSPAMGFKPVASARPATAVKTATPPKGVNSLPATRPASAIKPAQAKTTAVKKAPATASQAASKNARQPDKPRLKLIAATGAGLTLLFICLIILNSSMQISSIRIEEKMSAGEVAVRHESWDPGNSIVDITSLDPEIAEVDIFLVQDEEEPGFVHFLIDAKREGVADLVVEYENKDRKVISVTVEPSSAESSLVKEDRKSKTDTLEKVRDHLKTGDELIADANKSVENVYKALMAFQKAQRTIRLIRLHQFLPEYKGLDGKIKAAHDQIEVSYKKVEAEYQVARDRQMHWKARDLLKVLMQIVPDQKDSRYLKNRTYLDYVHNKEA